MPIYDKLYPPDEVCQCGRKKNEIHCPNCGSTNVIGYSKKTGIVKLLDGSPFYARGWSCRRCSLKFNDVDRGTCEYQPQKSMAEVRRSDEIKEAIAELPFEKRLEIAHKMLEKHGRRASTEVSSELRSEVEKQRSKPFEIGDDTAMIRQAAAESGAFIEEVKPEDKK